MTELAPRIRAYIATVGPAVQGQRGEDRALRVAGILIKGFGLSHDESWPFLLEYNATCVPPWEGEKELAELRRKLTEQEKQPGPRGHLLSDPPARVKSGRAAGDSTLNTDLGNACRFRADHGDDVRYCHPMKKWYVWDGTRWALDDSGAINRLVWQCVGRMLTAAGDRVKDLARQLRDAADEDKQRLKAALGSAQEAVTWAIASQSKGRLAAIADLGRSQPGVPVQPGEFNSDPYLLNCPNGTLDLRTGHLREHRRADHITQLCPVPFEPAAACPEWERTLRGIFPDPEGGPEGDRTMIEFVQRYLGLALTGITSEKVLAVWWGPHGNNGKSLLLRAVTDLMGDDYATWLSSEFLMTSQGERHPTETAGLFGRRLAIASESARTDRLNEGLVKRLTGDDVLTARRMKEDMWTFAPSHKLVLMTNHKPRVAQGGDPALWARVRLVPFTQSFWDPDKPASPGEDRPEHLRADKNLRQKLTAEFPGILAWLVRGCLLWQQDGLPVPASVSAATSGYRAESDSLGLFLSERCTLAGGLEVRGAVLYLAYENWAENSGETALSKRQLFAELRQRQGIEQHHNNGPCFRGLGLNNDGSTDGRSRSAGGDFMADLEDP